MEEDISEFIRNYYVYECTVDGVVRYVGMGKGNRYQHCTSGKSSCSELNRDFHAGKDLVVRKVKEKLSKDQARWEEYELINSLEGLYNIRKDISYDQIPDFKRSTKYKQVAEANDPKTKKKFMKFLANKCDDMDEESYGELKLALSRCGLSMFMVQYEGAAPILILDRTEIHDYEIKHLGCPNWPNCDFGGCGR